MTSESPLDNLYIAKPCDAKWKDMKGNSKVRLCSLCDKNVYNISNMKKEEAEELLNTYGNSVCVGYFRRADGTIITDDCPIGLKQIRSGYRLLKRTAAAILGILLSTNILGEKQAVAVEKIQNNLIAQNAGARFGTPPNTYRVKPRRNTLADAVNNSTKIVIASYQGRASKDKITFFDKPTANYKVMSALKGKIEKKTIQVSYMFHDESAFETPPGWHFTEDKMPKQEEVQILFLTPLFGDKIWSTYNGSYGRYKYTREHVEEIKKEVFRQKKLEAKRQKERIIEYQNRKRARHINKKSIPAKNVLGLDPTFVREDQKKFTPRNSKLPQRKDSSSSSK